jgi:hypothetical protein
MGEFLIATVLPYVLTFFFCGLVITTCIYLPQLGKGFIKLTTPSKILLGVALILGAYIRFQIVPSTQRVLFDEDRYLSYAVSFAKFGKAISVDIATTNHSISGKPDQAVRSTVPVTNALVLRTTHFSESAITGKIMAENLIVNIILDSPFTLKFPNSGEWFRNKKKKLNGAPIKECCATPNDNGTTG